MNAQNLHMTALLMQLVRTMPVHGTVHATTVGLELVKTAPTLMSVMLPSQVILALKMHYAKTMMAHLPAFVSPDIVVTPLMTAKMAPVVISMNVPNQKTLTSDTDVTLMPPAQIVLVHTIVNVTTDTLVMDGHVETLMNVPKVAMIVTLKQIVKILWVPGNVPVKEVSLEQVNNAMTSTSAHPRGVSVMNAVPMIAQAMQYVVTHMEVTLVPVKMAGTVMVRHAKMLMSVRPVIIIVI